MNKLFGISIVTPTNLNPVRSVFLKELYESIKTAGVDLAYEWVLVIDTLEEPSEDYNEIFEKLIQDPLVKIIKTYGSYGAATARNFGLSEAKYKFVTTVDDDDLLTKDSLEVRLDILKSNPEYKWVGALLADYFEDKETIVWDAPTKRGEIKAGELWRTWGHPNNIFPIGPTTLLINKDLLLKVGGWQGLPRAEDFGMVMAVTSESKGFVLDHVVYLYRKHGQQMTSQPGFDILEEKVRFITWQRGEILTKYIDGSLTI